MPTLLIVANILIALSYYTIAALVGLQLWRGRAQGINLLGLATAGIFFTCALGHSAHVLSFALLPTSSIQAATLHGTHSPAAVGTSLLWVTVLQTLVDVTTVVPAVGFLALRRRYGLLVKGEAVILDYERRIAVEQSLVAERTAELAAAEAQTRALNAIGQAVIVATPAGSLSYWNQAAEQMYGWSVAEAIGRSGFELVVPELREQATGALAAALTGAPQALELLMQRRDGTHFPGYVTITPVTLDDSQIVGVVAVVTDLSERQRNEEARLAMERSLQETQRLESLGVLAGGIAHDFNNILTGVLGYTELALLDIAPHSDAQQALQQVRIGAQRATELTQQMLAYAGKGRFLVAPLDLHMLIGEMAQLLAASLPKGVLLHYRLVASSPLIEGDATQMRQLVLNIVTNAAEAIDQGTGTITLTTQIVSQLQFATADWRITPEQRAANYLLFSVRDTGTGIDPLHLPQIFEPFYTTKFTGRGLGLAAVQGIVRGHNAALQVESQLGQGTIFTVAFPALSTAATAAQPASVAPARDLMRGHVLVIDDEQEVRVVAQRMLQRLGYTVLVAHDGATGLAMLDAQAATISAILLDLTMPGISSHLVAQHVQQQHPAIPLVLMSGYSEDAVRTQMSGITIAGFLQKPFVLKGLDDLLQRVMQQV